MSTSRSKASKSRTRIDALRAVIEKECTATRCRNAGVCSHEGEKEAARHMLARLLDNLQDAAQDERDERAAKWAEIYERGYDELGRTYRRGTKNRAGQDMKDRTASIRADIKMARKAGKTPLAGGGEVSQEVDLYRVDPIGEAPEQIEIRVLIGAGHGSIRIMIENIPTEWGWFQEENIHPSGQVVTRWRPTPALEALQSELKLIGEAYNADHGSDIMTDLFMKDFLVFVKADSPDIVAMKSKCERARRETKRR